MIDSAAKLEWVSADRPFKSGIPYCTPYLVVHSVSKIGWSGVRVKGTPSVNQHFPHIGLIVPVRILEEQKVWGLGHDNTSIRKHERRRNVQPVGEYGYFISFAVVVRILQNQNPIISFSLIIPNRIGVIHGLDHPQSTPFVPIHRNRLPNVRFTGKELQVESYWYLNQGL